MEKLLDDIFKNKTVLVTGHTGFKGSWLSIWLRELGADVIGYALDPATKDDNFVVTGLSSKITDIRGDIRDKEKLQEVFQVYKPEFVFHLAAQPLVRLSYDIPFETYDINVMGTLNVLECIRKSNSVQVGVMITTDKCYENREQIWGYRETDSLGGYDPYSSSKACAEMLISSYRNSFFNPDKFHIHKKSISSVRAGNVIGGGDWSKDRLIPDSIKALSSSRYINIRNPYSIRPWQHVLEPLYGYMLLASKMYENGIKYSGAWNFGPDEDSMVPVKVVADYIVKYWQSGRWVNLSSEDESMHEAAFLALDCTKAKTYLKWRPIFSLEEAIKYTVNWYKRYKSINVYDLCVEQIEDYIQKLKHQ